MPCNHCSLEGDMNVRPPITVFCQCMFTLGISSRKVPLTVLQFVSTPAAIHTTTLKITYASHKTCRFIYRNKTKFLKLRYIESYPNGRPMLIVPDRDKTPLCSQTVICSEVRVQIHLSHRQQRL
jgi:hypothetical protein